MTGRSHELNSEAAQVPADGAENIGVGFARRTAAGAHLAQAQRTTKKFAKFLVESDREANLFIFRLAQHEVAATTHRHSVIASLRDGLLRTDFHAGGAENTATEIERHRLSF